jgi:peptidoglycan hydrolase-like protein with peptidoglycan-binding domain
MKARQLIVAFAATGALSLAGAAMAQTSSGGSMSDQSGTGYSSGLSSSGSQGSAMNPSNFNDDQVRRIQQALKNSGQDLTVDGKWGAESQEAVRKFQQAQGLSANGQLTQETMAALNVSPTGQGTGSSGGYGSGAQGGYGSGSGGLGSGNTMGSGNWMNSGSQNSDSQNSGGGFNAGGPGGAESNTSTGTTGPTGGAQR